MKIRNFVALSVLLALIMSLAPAPRALADGAASTRNILMGLGAVAGTLIIINHNKKVHEKYAADAQQAAVLSSQRNDAWAAYRSEQRAYNNQVALSGELKEEVALKDGVIKKQQTALEQQRQQLASMGVKLESMPVAVTAPRTVAAHQTTSKTMPMQVVSYGWGTL